MWFGRFPNFLRGGEFNSPTSIFAACSLGRPALRLAHHEIAEDLNSCHGLQLFRIDKICVELDRIGFAEQLHQAGYATAAGRLHEFRAAVDPWKNTAPVHALDERLAGLG